jgi:hypothetical protein
MTSLTVELAISAGATAPKLERFCHRLARVVRAGAFATADWDDCSGAGPETLDSDSSRVRVTIPLAHESCADVVAVRELFTPPTEVLAACRQVLLAVQGPQHGGTPQIQGRLANWQARGMLHLAPGWPEGEPCTVGIEFAGPVEPSARVAWRENLEALESVVAEAPFLGCQEGRYSMVGECAVHWLGPRHANYWTAGVAGAALWSSLLSNQLFNNASPAPALSVKLLH